MSIVFAVVAVASGQPAPLAAPAPEKKICRAELATGSLVRRTRTCRTRAEWERAYAAARTRAEDARRPLGWRNPTE